MPIDIVLGLQWGDEGKGKIVDAIADRYDWVARYQGGPNAGHTVVVGGRKYILHQIPSGAIHARPRCIIGNGAIIDPIILAREVADLEAAGIDLQGRLYISERAHFILPSHRWLDAAEERARGADAIGATLRGIMPTYRDKAARRGLRIMELLAPDFDARARALFNRHLEVLPHEFDFGAQTPGEAFEAFLQAAQGLRRFQIAATELLIHEALVAGQNILAEGAQGAGLDVDFGSYPYVTSSFTTAGGACVGLGAPPTAIRQIIGVTKAYATRVGAGPFPTELSGDAADKLRAAGHEFGSTTGRPRRCGWLDLPALRYAVWINGVTQLAVTKLDVLAGLDAVRAACAFRTADGAETNLPVHHEPAEPVWQTFPGWPAWNGEAEPDGAARDFVNAIAEFSGAPVAMTSWGPGRESLFWR